MVGVARQASIMHKARTEHYKNGHIGILDEKDCAKLIKVVKNLQDVEQRIFSFCSSCIEFERRLVQNEAKQKSVTKCQLGS